MCDTVGHERRAGEQAVGAVAIVVPAGMVEDRVEAHALDRHAERDRGVCTSRRIMREPGGRALALDAGLGDEDRAAVARVGLGQDCVERAAERVVVRRAAGRRGSTGCCGRN